MRAQGTWMQARWPWHGCSRAATHPSHPHTHTPGPAHMPTTSFEGPCAHAGAPAHAEGLGRGVCHDSAARPSRSHRFPSARPQLHPVTMPCACPCHACAHARSTHAARPTGARAARRCGRGRREREVPEVRGRPCPALAGLGPVCGVVWCCLCVALGVVGRRTRSMPQQDSHRKRACFRNGRAFGVWSISC